MVSVHSRFDFPRMGDMIQEFLEVFAVVAHTIVKKVLEENTALLQDVSSKSFPKVGQPPVVHQVNQNLKFKKHAVRASVVETDEGFSWSFFVGGFFSWEGAGKILKMPLGNIGA